MSDAREHHGPVFLVAAPGSGARRLAAWLSGQAALRNVRVATIDAALGPTWQAQHDQWAGLDPAALRAAIRQRRRADLQPAARIEQDDRLALNVTALASCFPRARFVYLYRDVRETLARMLELWGSDEHLHRSGVQLSDGHAWHLPLPPGWSARTQKRLPEVVAWQWSTCTRIALDALEQLPAPRWCVASYDRLLSEPVAEHRRLRRFLRLGEPEVNWITPRFRRHDLTSPDARQWQQHSTALAPVLGIVAKQADRAVKLFAEPPATRVWRKA